MRCVIKQAVFRADGGSLIGMGHIMRCLTLAEHLRRQGAAVLFLGRGETLAQLQRHPAHWPCHRIPDGLSPMQDALFCRTALLRLAAAPDYLIVDHYGLGKEWESCLRPHARRLVAMDDLGRAHDADMVLDTGMEAARHYPKHAFRLLAGPRYALLRGGFARARAHAAALAHKRRGRRLFICFGGSDPARMTLRAAQAVSGRLPADVQVDVLSGPGYRDGKELLSLCAQPGWTLYDTHKQPERLMAEADLAIGAGGTMNYERCAVGLPSIVITIADNQRETTQALHEKGVLLYAGHYDRVSDAQLAQAVGALLEDGQERCRMAGQALALVDTHGAARIVRAMRHG